MASRSDALTADHPVVKLFGLENKFKAPAIRTPSPVRKKRKKEDKKEKKKEKKKKKDKKDKKGKKSKKQEKQENSSSGSSSSSSGSASSSEPSKKAKKEKGVESTASTSTKVVEIVDGASVPEVQTDSVSNPVFAALEAGDLSQLPAAVRLLSFGRPEEREAVAVAIANLTPSSIDKEGTNKVAVARAGAIRPLVAVLRESGDSPELQKQAARALHNLTSKNAENKAAVSEAGAVVPLIAVLRTGEQAAQEQAAGVLRNLTATSPEQKAAVFSAGAVSAISSLLKAGFSADAQANLAVLLYNLANGHADRRQAVANADGVIPGLVDLMAKGPTLTVQREAADTLRVLGAGGAKPCKAIFEAGVVPPLAALVKVRDAKAQKVALQLKDCLVRLGGAEVKDAVSSAV